MSNSFNPELIPNGLLKSWVESRRILETPVGFDLAVGISAIGACLRRNVWIDQIQFKVYPNISVLLVGPSGIGKDTAINGVASLLQGNVGVIGGRTAETIVTTMMGLGDPACAVLLAKELSEFFGPKEYQQGMLETITELLSTGDSYNASLKSNPNAIVQRPTLTVMGGSTKDWLHKAMPPEAMTGGFYPRFLIVYEEQGKRHVPWVEFDTNENELRAAEAARNSFYQGLQSVVMANFGKMTPSDSAKEIYRQFYVERRQYFSPNSEAYAHRCRDTVLRIAMVSAVSRMSSVIEDTDMNFAVEIIKYVGKNLDNAMAPPTLHNRIAMDIIRMLPATRQFLFREMEKKYDMNQVKKAFDSLVVDTNRIYQKGNIFYLKED